MKNKTINQKDRTYETLIFSIIGLLRKSRNEVYSKINQILVKTYWEIGKEIVEYEQKGKTRAEYGLKLLDKLSSDLKLRYGKGFSRSNIVYMRLFYLKYPKSQTLSDQLSWSHYIGLLSISNGLARNFYEKQCIMEKWSVRELKRQVNSMLFERISLSKDKKGVLKLSNKGHVIDEAKDLVKDPYILEFLGIPESYRYSENELEQRIIDNLQNFLLELGKGFTFVARQFRINFRNKHFFVDLVFYNRILKCFVLIELKIGEVTHKDIGQMNMYLNYFKEEEMTEGDNDPVGIILSAEKDNFLVKYALGGMSNKLFVSQYKLYLPSKEELEKELSELFRTSAKQTKEVIKQ